ncbi:MAG: ATP-binding protein [Cyanobium sp.]
MTARAWLMRGPFRLSGPRHLSGRVTLVNSLQMLLLGGSLSWFAYSLGRHEGLLVSEQIRKVAVVQELSQRLSQRLSAPRTINALNQLEIASGSHPLSDYDHYARLFWRQMQVFPVAYINYGGISGDFIGVERRDDGQLLLQEDTPLRGRGRLATYSLNARGERGRLRELTPGMSALHEEAWYTDTVKAGRSTWSSIYSWEDRPETFSISYNTPLYGADRRLQGVIGVDIVLSQLSTWLAGLWKQQDGLALIVEPDGRLVASSRPADTLDRRDNRLQRRLLQDLRDPVAQALLRAKFIQEDGRLKPKPGVLETIHAQSVQVNGRELHIDASPWGREEGLNWVLLTAVPANPVTVSSQRSANLARVLSVSALLLALLLTNRQIRFLLKPLSRLERAALELGKRLQSGPGHDLEFHGNITAADGTEMEALARAISALVAHFNGLNAELRNAAERERLRDAQTMALLQTKLRCSLEAAAVAHEINQPLSVVLWNSQLLLEELRTEPAPQLPEGWHGRIQSISQEAERVVTTNETMRSLLRNVATEPQPLDLREVVRSAVLYLRSGDLDPELTIDTLGLEDREPPAWMAGDAAQIQILLVNLLRNATQALADAGTREPWIGIALAHEGAGWLLSVDDNGPGFPADAQPEAPLESRRAGGSGLGLFVVQTTAENHRGRVSFGRSPRGGARVCVHFPDARVPSPGDPTTGD